MSTTWSGFSEADIKKLSSNDEVAEVPKFYRNTIKAKRRVDKKITNSKINLQLKSADTVYSMTEDAKLSTKEEVPRRLEGPLTQPVASEIILNGTNNANPEIKCTNNSIILETCKIEKKVIDLDEFQARQKRIEEQNRRRKELLAKALEDRTKQTEEEAKRLKDIQDEFKKLDALLSNDVSILRHQIELASLDFMEAQKKYNKIERDFLDAKLNLHQKLEKKEMLTEHLCAIIEKNEERKAEKLNDLMCRLTVGGKNITDAYESIENEEKIILNTNETNSNDQ